MSSNTCFLIARDTKTNDFEITGEFSSLKEADLYTTNYHNNKDLARRTWNGIVPAQEIDFFILMPVMYNKEVRMEIKDILFSNSKEIKMLDNHEKRLNTLKHFEEKIESSNEFLDEVSLVLYEEVKNYLLRDSIDEEISYQNLRDAVLSFNNIKNPSDKQKKLYRLMVERVS